MPANSQTLDIYGLGGTIAGTATTPGDTVGYRAGTLGLDVLLRGLPRPPGCTVNTHTLAAIDSKDMSAAVWRTLVNALRAAPPKGAAVVTHGTDTLEETAHWLWRLGDFLPRPTVLTAAMRPADAPGADGPGHLVDALALAADLARRHARSEPHAAWVTLHGRVWRALDVSKIRPYHLPAFDGGESAPWGWVENGHVRWLRDPATAARPAPGDDAPSHQRIACGARRWLEEEQPDGAHAAWPWVEVIQAGAQADARLVPALVQAGVEGLVVAGLGNAQIPGAWEAPLAEALARGVAVWRASRCPQGQGVPAGEPPFAAPQHSAQSLSLARLRLDLCLTLMAFPEASAAGGHP